MNKRYEIPIVIVISALTVLSAGIAIHDINSDPSSPSGVMSHALDHVRQWVSGHPKQVDTPQLTSSSEKSLSSLSSSLPAPGQVMWSASDLNHIQGIVSGLIGGLTTSEWGELQKALSSDSPRQAEQVVVPILMAHISTSNQAWLSNHFSGQQAFDQEDVQLLQETLRQAEGELTPSEQELIGQRLSQLWTTLASNRTP